jgi:hypothetical protein
MHPELAAFAADLPSALRPRFDALVARLLGGSIPPRYDDVGRIGVGGMGEVRRVHDRELGRTCAYKSVKPELMGKPSAVARFVEEAQIGAQLQTPTSRRCTTGGVCRTGGPGSR